MFQLLRLGLRQALSRVIYISLGLSFCGPLATASSKLHPHAEFLKDAPNSRITVTRYSGRPDFNSMQSLAWSLGEDGRYHAGNRLYNRIQEGLIGPCESFLADQQKFSLKKMISTHYLQNSDLPKYLRLGESFETGQVNFVMRSRDVSEYLAKLIAGPDYDERINHIIREWDTEKIPFITATSWSVAGQMLDPHNSQTVHLDLPWQKDPDRKELSQEFRRQRRAGKYKFVVEWGRTAQDLPLEAEPLGAALASINYQEMQALGVDLNDAYIMFHSFDELNTRAYSMRFPKSIYPEDWKNKGDALFLVPLAKVLEQFPPSKYSAKMNGIIKNSNGKLNEAKALELLARFNRIEFNQLDVRGRNGEYLPRPLAVRDVSLGAAQKRIQLFRDFGLEDEINSDDLANHMMKLHGILPNWNSGQYTDLSDMSISVFNMQAENAIEISNLDHVEAVLDKDYVVRMLLEVYYFYLKGFFKPPLTQEMLNDAAHALVANKIKFALTTFDDVLMRKIRALNPASEYSFAPHYVGGTDLKDPLAAMPGQEWLAMGYVKPPVTFYFSAEQVLELARARADLFKATANGAEDNVWMRFLMLTTPDVF